MRILILCITLFLMSCSELDDSKRIVIPKDIPENQITNHALDEKGLFFVMQLGQHSPAYDRNGLLLPWGDGSHFEQGDALLWNSMALSSLCYIQAASRTRHLSQSYSPDQIAQMIEQVWGAVQTKLQMPDGRLVRHPDYAAGIRGTSISKDGIAGVQFLGASAFETDCTQVKATFGNFIYRFAKYAHLHGYEMGIGQTDTTVTYLTDRHLLKAVLDLYDQDSSFLNLSTSFHNLEIPAKVAKDIFYRNKQCTDPGLPAEVKELCHSDILPGVFVNHLVYLGLYTSFIDTLYNEYPLHSLKDLQKWTKNLAMTGLDKHPNWLFIQLYRIMTFNNTYNDVKDFLSDFPTGTSEQQGHPAWGCTDYIWQRLPGQRCSGINKNYLGIDFLLPFGMLSYYE